MVKSGKQKGQKDAKKTKNRFLPLLPVFALFASSHHKNVSMSKILGGAGMIAPSDASGNGNLT
ncbi:MAG: hypothetical protein J2P31_04520 [Blastocatellia bacterium]|nr:hypothetical protein [Blastocatellia bacterium]